MASIVKRQLHRAAFEQVSKLTFRPHDQESDLDLRFSHLPSQRPSSHDYNPREHRIPIQPIKEWMAYFNVLRTLTGAGVLGMPLAISQAGMLLGPILALFTGLLVIHTHLLLLECLNEISCQLKIPYISYRYGFRLALLHGPKICQCIGERGPAIIATFMILSQLGICVVFVLMTTDSLRDIMDWDNSRPALLAMFVLYLLLEYFMKTLKIVSYVAMFGNVLNMVGLSLAFYHIFKYPQGEIIIANTEAIPLLVSFGTFLFNLSAVGVILSMDKALHDPKVMIKKYGVVRVGIFIPTIIAVLFGALGYWSFGTMEENILRSLPFDDYSAMVCIALYLISVAFAYPLQCYPGIQVIREVIQYHDPNAEPSQTTLRYFESTCRPLFVCMSFVISYLIPFQGPFVAFVGNVCTTLLALVFPALMDLCLRYPDNYGPRKIVLIKNIAIIAVGLTSWTFGAILCAYLIYVRIQAMYNSSYSEYLR